MLEKKFVEQAFTRWSGNIPVSYLYTSGIAGEHFFTELKNKGRILGTVCPKCRLIYLPPRLFCERCFKKLENWKAVSRKGTVLTYTIAYHNSKGEPLVQPVILALVGFKEVTGGLIHKIDEILPQEVKIGMTVIPVFEDKTKRQGNIFDIKYFKPA